MYDMKMTQANVFRYFKRVISKCWPIFYERYSMKHFIKSFIVRLISLFGYKLIRSEKREDLAFPCSSASKATQRSLSLQYRTLLSQQAPLPKLSDVGFRVYSQTDEDGIVLFLFSVIGTTNKIFIEIGTGNGIECKCANLAINWGWHGLFIDGNEQDVASGIIFYDYHPDTNIFPPKFKSAMVDRENINETISNAGFSGEIDILSIDIDGMDYWVWEAIDCVNPRVVVVEANGKFGMRSITVPYDAEWAYEPHLHPHYHGASLPAFTKLAKRKGYRLVGTNRFGFNAFYVRDDIGQEILPAVTIESCRTHLTRKNDERIFDKISHLPYVEI